MTLKKFVIAFLIFDINYLKCTVGNFPYFVNLQFYRAYLNWLCMTALARILAFSTVRNLWILRRAWSLNDAFLHIFAMSILNFSWLSVTIPSSSTSLKLLIFLTLIFKAKEVLCLSPRITKWNLRNWFWTNSKHFWDHIWDLKKHFLIFCQKCIMCCHPRNRKTSDFAILRDKSLINIFKKKRPKNWPLWNANVDVKPRTEGWSCLSPLLAMSKILH